MVCLWRRHYIVVDAAEHFTRLNGESPRSQIDGGLKVFDALRSNDLIMRLNSHRALSTGSTTTIWTLSVTMRLRTLTQPALRGSKQSSGLTISPILFCVRDA